MQIKLKRAYEDPGPQDGIRVIVDRAWPKWVSESKAAIDIWLKEVAPSDDLSKWFEYYPDKREEFKRIYFQQLDADDQGETSRLVELAGEKGVTLVYGAENERFNNGRALKEYLEEKSSAGCPR